MPLRRKSCFSLMLAGAGIVFAVPAARAELVIDGGFESGDFAGWTQAGNVNSTTVSGDPTFVHSGSYGAKLGPSGSDGFLSQALETTPGQSYRISFFLESINNNVNGSAPNDFSAAFGAATLLNVTDISPQSYTQYTFDQTASSASTLLQFGFRNDPSYLGLDDISVTPSPAPEPSSWKLVGLTCLGLGGLMLRARKTCHCRQGQ